MAAIRSWCWRSTRTATISQASARLWQAPLGTYTGWNLRDRGQGEGYMHEFTGSYVPLPETDSVRRSTADPALDC